MSSSMQAVESVAMTASGGNEERGEAIKKRRLALTIRSLRAFEEVSGLGRDTVGKAEAGDPTVRDGTYDAIEASLTRLEEAWGMDDPDLVTSSVELELGGKVYFSGTNPTAVAEAVAAFVKAQEAGAGKSQEHDGGHT